MCFSVLGCVRARKGYSLARRHKTPGAREALSLSLSLSLSLYRVPGPQARSGPRGPSAPGLMGQGACRLSAAHRRGVNAGAAQTAMAPAERRC